MTVYKVKGFDLPVFNLKKLIEALLNLPDFLEDVLQTSTYNGMEFGDVTSGLLFHYFLGDCEEKGIIPLQAHLYFDHVPVTRKDSAGPLFIHFPNTKSHFNRKTYYMLSYCSYSTLTITDILPFALKQIEELNNLGKIFFILSLSHRIDFFQVNVKGTNQKVRLRLLATEGDMLGQAAINCNIQLFML